MFRLTVTPSLVALGIGFAFTLGFIGGLFPAIRAARLPVADALRATYWLLGATAVCLAVSVVGAIDPWQR